jgi:hypothetical protein
MMEQQIEHEFEAMGARVKVMPHLSSRRNTRALRSSGSMTHTGHVDTIQIDIQRDGVGEFFDVRKGSEVRIEIPDCLPAERHLLLIAHHGRWGPTATYLCGRDERSWFVAAIPESANAHTVQSAMDALKPKEVWLAMQKFEVPMENRNRRRTAAFVRQGEWFFIPRPGIDVPERNVLHDEPIRRGAGNAHMCQFLHRVNGELVWVNKLYPNGLTKPELDRLLPAERKMSWWPTRRNARVFVRGYVRHPDHSAIWLMHWHQVVMNTETQARAMQHVAFLD